MGLGRTRSVYQQQHPTGGEPPLLALSWDLGGDRQHPSRTAGGIPSPGPAGDEDHPTGTVDPGPPQEGCHPQLSQDLLGTSSTLQEQWVPPHPDVPGPAGDKQHPNRAGVSLP